MLFRRRSQDIDILRRVPLFSKLNKDHLNQIAKHAVETSIRKGELLARQGTKGSDFTFIVEGKAWVEKDGKIINYLSEGEFFGEISLIDGKPRAASVIAETDMTVLVVNRNSFEHLLEKVPGMQKSILLSLCSYLRKAGTSENKQQ